MGQFSAVIGRRIRPKYVDMINAQTPYLYGKYRLREDKAFRDKEFALEEEKFESDTAFSAQELEEQKKQAKRANLLGIGNLGVMYGMMSKKNKVLKDIYESSGPAKDTIAPAVPNAATKTALAETGKAAVAETPKFFSGAGAGTTSNWVSPAKTWQPYAAGLTGATVGADLGEKYVPIGGKKEKRIIGGTVVGGGLGYMLSGGNPYAAAISAVIGGGGGGFF